MSRAPELGRHRQRSHMAMPILALALDFAEYVPHSLLPGALRRHAVLGPTGQVLQVEG